VPPELILSIHTVNEAAAVTLRQTLEGLSTPEIDLRTMMARVTANARLYY
jgi:hypothetical protein